MKNLLLAVGCAVLLAAPAQAAIIHVDAANTSGVEDGSEAYPYDTIQEGIDAAAIGADWESADVVSVREGIYYGAVIMKHHVKLVGVNPARTVIDGSGVSGPTVQGPLDPASPNPNCWIEGFTIRNSINLAIRTLNRANYYGSSLWEIRNCYFIDNWQGVYAALGSGYNVQNCVFTGGNHPADEFGVKSILDFREVTVTNSTFDNFNGYPIWIIGNYYPHYLTNSILSNVDYLFKANRATLTSRNNDFWNYDQFNAIDDSTLPFVLDDADSINLDPKYVNAAGGDYHLQAGSHCIDAGVGVGLPFNGDAPDMGAFEYDQLTLAEGLEGLAASFSNLAPEALKSSNEKRRDAFLNKVEAILNQLEAASMEDDAEEKRGALQGMRMKLEKDLLAKCDGNHGGSPQNDWIVDNEEKDNFYNEILNLIDIVDEQLAALGA